MSRWLLGLGALLIAALAFYVLTMGDPPESSRVSSPAARTYPVPKVPEKPAMDEIDAKSRARMRDLLRDADGH